MDHNEQADFLTGLNRLKRDPLQQVEEGRRSYLQTIACLSAFLSRSLPIQCIAAFRPNEDLLLCQKGSLQVDLGFHSIMQSLQAQLDWTAAPEGALLSALEANARGVFPDTAFCARSLHTTAGTFLGIALFGKSGSLWTAAEQDLLRPACTLLELVVSWEAWSVDCLQQNDSLNDILDSMGTGIYVTDPENDCILFMNQSMKSMLRIQHPEGKRCWEVLQKGMTRRCDFCPVPHLLSSEEAHPSFLWEYTNTRSGHVYENHDALMPWVDGRMVHVQQSIDVTEVSRLYQSAIIDDLTGLLNRQAGRENLQKLLDSAKQGRQMVTVCLLDISGFQAINEIYGYQVGDNVIVAMAHAIRSAAGPEACRFRMSGDKFLIGLPGISLAGAAQVIQQIQIFLSQNHPPELAETPGFQFGMLELPPSHALSLTDVLGAVDEKLYEKKRSAHIQTLEQGLSQVSQALSPEAFEYNHALLYSALVQSTDDYVFIYNVKTDTFRYPPSMAEDFNLPSEVLQHAAMFWKALIHEDDRPAFLEANQDIMDGRAESQNVEYRAKNRAGDWVWLRCRGHMERDETGQPALFAGIITNLGKKNQIDHLTGLLNKLEFEAQAQCLFAQSHREPFTMMLFGLDDLRHINSLYDRAFGDEVIRIASQKLQSMLPANAYVFRLDGDEFGALIRGAHPEKAESFYHRVQAAFSHQQTLAGRKFFCTLSCGCVFAPQHAADYQQLVKYAHFSLEHAKQHGKNRLCFFSQSLVTHRERLLTLMEQLRESVEHGFSGFSLHFQPVTDGNTNQLRGAEALCRWQCDLFGSISPVEFIPLLEQSGLILPVGRWIFQRAIETCVQWQRVMPTFIMGVNLSNLQLEDPTFISFMEETITNSGVDPSRVVVELTESYLASNVESLSSYLERLHHLQVLVSMDDFGTGYSSLGILKQYPIDIVKIDRTFVKGIQSSTFDSAFIQFVVDLCHKLGMAVCLEGVETQEQLNVVQPMNLNFYQGFYFGRPMPKESFEAQFFPAPSAE